MYRVPEPGGDDDGIQKRIGMIGRYQQGARYGKKLFVSTVNPATEYA
jgi:hypothetical protein